MKIFKLLHNSCIKEENPAKCFVDFLNENPKLYLDSDLTPIKDRFSSLYLKRKSLIPPNLKSKFIKENLRYWILPKNY